MRYRKMVAQPPVMIMRASALLLFLLNASAATQTTISLKDCPTDYVPEESSCLCVATNLRPSGRLLWKDPAGRTVISGQDSQTSLPLPFSAVKTGFNGKKYVCELVDGSYSTVITYKPKVAQPPAEPVLQDCPTDFILPTEDANCTCRTKTLGLPAAVLVWEDPEYNAVTFTSKKTWLSLPFSAVQANFSERTYHCVLRHITGDLSVPYTPYLVVKPDAPVIDGLKGSYAPGEMVQLKCTVTGGVPGTQRIFFSCTNYPDRPDRIEGSQLTSSLIFQAKTTDNNTQCDCYGTNDFFQSSIRSFIFHVGMTGDPEALPRISLEGCPRYFVSNTSSCTCEVENLGNSVSTVLWKDPDGKTSSYVETSNQFMTLTLTKVDVKFNKRQYQCELLHKSGAQRISYTLQFAEPPSEPQLVNCPEAEAQFDPKASCTCMTTSLGEPAGFLVWYDPDQNQVNSTGNGTSLVLPFSALNETYLGQTYTCKVRHMTRNPEVKYKTPKLTEADYDKVDDSLSGGDIAEIVIAVVVVVMVVILIIVKKRRGYIIFY